MRSLIANRKSRVALALWSLELLLIYEAVNVAAWLRFVGEPEAYAVFVRTEPVRALLVAVAMTMAMAAFGLYQTYARHRRQDLSLRLLVSFGFGSISLLVLYYLAPVAHIGRGVLAMALSLSLGGIYLLRMGARHAFRGDAFKRRVLVLGAGNNANLINLDLIDRQFVQVVGFVPLPGQPEVIPPRLQVRPDRGLVEIAMRLQVNELVVAPDERRGGLPMEEMLQCTQQGISVTDLSSFFEREVGMVELEIVDPSWLVFSGGFDHSLPRRLSKRFFDLVAAAVLLLVSWPVMLLVALAVWLETGSPILYRQTRVGKDGRAFELYKFRSMRVDAESDGIARWASENDDRTTRVGRFIRKTRLDELPQLFNVLRGQMSFVGPRPERPQFVDQLSQAIRYYPVRHCVKPGLTGWAQLRYPYGASVLDAKRKLKYDLFYVKNHGLLFDLMILLQTVEVVLFGRGAR